MTIKSGLVWDFLGKLVNQGVTFVVSIFLARLLLPQDFALVAMVMAFYGIARIFIDFGFSAAIVQRIEVTQVQLSSIFWFSSFFSIALSIVCFLSATSIAEFYGQDGVLSIARVMSFIILINAFGGVHAALLQKRIKFKELSRINIIGSLLSGAVGVLMALNNFGVWSLVAQYYIAGLVRLPLLWRATRWLPSFLFSFKSTKPLFLYGKNIFLSQLLTTFFQQLDVLVIGKLFLPATLGLYSRAKSLNLLIAQHSSGSLNAVLFPAISKIQNNKLEVRELVEKFFHLAAFVSFFLGGWLYLVAEDLIVLLFTEKWISSVPYFKIMVLSTFAYPVSAIVLNPINSLGRSDIFLKLEVVKRLLMLVVYYVGFQFGLIEFLYGMLFFSIVGVILNCYVSGKLINWTLGAQLLLLLRYGTPVYLLTYIIDLLFSDFSLTFFTHLILATLLFVIAVLLYSLFAKLEGFLFLKDLIQKKLTAILLKINKKTQ